MVWIWESLVQRSNIYWFRTWSKIGDLTNSISRRDFRIDLRESVWLSLFWINKKFCENTIAEMVQKSLWHENDQCHTSTVLLLKRSALAWTCGKGLASILILSRVPILTISWMAIGWISYKSGGISWFVFFGEFVYCSCIKSWWVGWSSCGCCW